MPTIHSLKAIIYIAEPNAKRIKFFVPYKEMRWREAVRDIETSWWHPEQKLWSIVNKPALIRKLEAIFDGHVLFEHRDNSVKIPFKELNETSHKILEEIEKSIILKGYSSHTARNYRSAMIDFLSFFESHDIPSLTKKEIESYVYHLIQRYKISNSKQNTVINAIKFYYEHVLGKPREYYDLQRPKSGKQLPNVLSVKEVLKLINTPKNIKHRAILYTLYSAGLRLNELINLRIEDIHRSDGFIFVKGGKGKVDRRTILSQQLIPLLEAYYRKHRPAYWLFEGADGGRYGSSTVQKVFRKAVRESNINPWATPHTLRHSFATHLMQQGISTRKIQICLGHASVKTTEIYTHVINVNNKTILSPLDYILDKNR